MPQSASGLLDMDTERRKKEIYPCTYYVLYNTTNTIIHNTINKSPWPVLTESRSDQINLHV